MGGYDTGACHQAIAERGDKALIPPWEEAYCRIVALNCMTTLGMPESVPVAA